MKTFYQAYPQFICADSTYKLLDIRIPVFVLMAEDSNGQSEVIAIGLLVSEDKETLKWFFETFRSQNELPARKTIVIMTDKDLTERSVIKDVFPDAFLRICLFHVLRSFNREVTCQKMGITPSQRDTVKELFQKLCYCSTLENYEETVEQLKTVAEKSVWDYFQANWNSIKNEWSSIASCNIASYLNTTNNRLESFNSKLKSVCTYFSSLNKFVTNLFIVLKSLRTERDNASSKMILKMPTNPLMNADEEIFFHVLTPYAFQMVREQLKLSEAMHNENLSYTTTEIMCNCKFRFSMCLPCKHIFFSRRKNALPIFDETLCDQRWTRDYFLQNSNLLNEDSSTVVFENATTNSTKITVAEQSPTVLSVQQKYKKAVMVTNKLASITAERSQGCFEERIKLLENMYQLWSEGREFSIVTTDQEASFQMHTEVAPEMLNLPEEVNTSSEFSQNATSDNIEETSSTNNEILDEADLIKNIIMPSKVKMRGRPKGATLTAVGLPRRKNGSKLIPFEKKHYVEKQDILLSWFLDSKIIEKIKKENYLAEETDIECRPEKITSAILHETVDINLIRCFFSRDGWNMLKSVIESKRANHTLVCPACSTDIGAENSIICGLCLLTHHSKCVGLKISRKKVWYCYTCHNTQI